MPSIKLIQRIDKNQPGFNVAVALNSSPVKGDVGIEVEVEGNKFPKPEGFEGSHKPVKMQELKFWSYVHDGSLRGEDNAEYILTKPIKFAEVEGALKELFDRLKAFGSVIADSNRTSVHVHLNCQGFHFNRLTSFMAIYFALEEVLTEWCGEHRVGNLFCLRAVDAPAIITHLKKFIKTDGVYGLHEILRYGGLNPNALHKHGSLEVRTLRGTPDMETILAWVGILQRLYELSKEFTDPRDVPGMFSSHGPNAFFEKLLGEHAKTVQQTIGWNNDQIADAMFRGIRLAQDLCNCRDWDAYQTMDVRPDPFGRNSRLIAAKIVEELHGPVTGEEFAEEMAQEPQSMNEYLSTMAQLSQAVGWNAPPMEDDYDY